MATRRQSTRDDRIVITERESRLPSAGSPRIEGLGYDPEPILDVNDTINDTDPIQTTIEAPRNVEILEQRIRFAPDGTQYVTVTVQFDEVENAQYYETRISKR